MYIGYIFNNVNFIYQIPLLYFLLPSHNLDSTIVELGIY